jgi:ribosomal protein L7/L12
MAKTILTITALNSGFIFSTQEEDVAFSTKQELFNFLAANMFKKEYEEKTGNNNLTFELWFMGKDSVCEEGKISILKKIHEINGVGLKESMNFYQSEIPVIILKREKCTRDEVDGTICEYNKIFKGIEHFQRDSNKPIFEIKIVDKSKEV